MAPFGQTLWGTLLINFLIGLILLLPILYTLTVVLLNHHQPRLSDPLSPPRWVTRGAWIFIALLLFCAVCLLTLALIPLDRLLAWSLTLFPGRKFVSLTEPVFHTLAAAARWLGGGILAVSALAVWRAKNYVGLFSRFCTRLANYCHAVYCGCRQLLQEMKARSPGRTHWLWIGLLTLCGALIRWGYLDKPFLHDEAYTYVGFASRSLRAVMTDYSLPNNHVLHSMLVYFSTQLFGVEPWAVRLPAYLCGMLCIPCAYFVARKIYNSEIALLAAAGVAAMPDLALRSSDARGYMPMALFTLLIFWLGLVLRQKPNRFAGLMLVVISALGFYNLPIMVYPFGGLLLWLALCALSKDIGADYTSAWQFIGHLVQVGVGTVLLTGLLYSPIIIWSGAPAIFGNAFVQPLGWEDFLTILPERWGDLWWDLRYQTPLAGIWFGVGLSLALVFDRKLTRRRIPWLGTLLVWIAISLAIQRPNMWSRLWTFLVPLLVISMAGGWVWLLQWMRVRSMPIGLWLMRILAVVALAFALLTSIEFRMDPEEKIGQVEAVALTLQGQLVNGDLVLSISPNEPVMWYYFRRHAIPWSYLELAPEKAQRLIIITYENESETPLTILEKRRISPQSFDVEHQSLQQMDGVNIFTIPRSGSQ